MFAALEWFRRLRRRRRYGSVRTVESMAQVPQAQGDDVYVVAGSRGPKWAAFECPCTCGDTITVNLMRTVRPAWSARINARGLTLRPSLWRTRGTCGSHFFLRANAVVWIDELRIGSKRVSDARGSARRRESAEPP